VAAPTAPEPSPAETRPVEAIPAAPVEEPDYVAAQLLRLWRELHPQGRRAVFAYIAALLVEI
jgi:hypothetical protein